MCRPGLDYPCTALTDGQRALLPLFEELSLIVRGTGSAADRFFPTPHGVDLLFGVREALPPPLLLLSSTHLLAPLLPFSPPALDAQTARSEVETSLRAVVETNFRLYVYTESPVYVAVVRKFAELKVRHAARWQGSDGRTGCGVPLTHTHTHAHAPPLRPTRRDCPTLRPSRSSAPQCSTPSTAA